MARLNGPSVQKELHFKNVRLLTDEELGHGSFGIVCKAQCDELICAAKVIYRVLCQAVAPDPGKEHRIPIIRFQSEIDFLKRVHHPNIVQYLGTHHDQSSGSLVLLMELMDESLTHFVESSPGNIPYHTQVNLSYDIAQALAFLHANGVIHRDLSSNNVLLAGTKAKVTDFGMSQFTDGKGTKTAVPGTIVFMPPEALSQPPVYTEKLDNFSFGVLLVQIMTRKFPELTDQYQEQELINPHTNKIIKAFIPVSEIERRHAHIDLIQQDHPLLQIALDCLKDNDLQRPPSQELCRQLYSLKKSYKFKESSRQVPAQTNGETAPNQQLQREISEKNEQIQQLQVLNKQQQDKIDKLELGLEMPSKEGKSRENLKWLKDQLAASEQITASLQEALDQRDREVRRLKQNVAIKEDVPKAHSVQKDTGESLIVSMNWEPLPNSPSGIWAGSIAKVGDKVYVNSWHSQTIYEFKIRSRQWFKVESHPINEFTLVSVENTLTSVGGESDGKLFGKSLTNKLYSYTNQKWNELLPKMPTKRLLPGVAYTSKRLIVAGGFNGKYLSTVEILNTVNKQWSSVSSLPFPTSQPSTCISGESIYIHPGLVSNDSEKTSVLKCPLKALIQPKPSAVWENMASPPVSHSTLTSVADRLIAMGGSDFNFTPTNNIYQYNTITRSWTVVSQMSAARHHCLPIQLEENLVMVVGGVEDVSKAQNSEIAVITVNKDFVQHHYSY